MAIISANLPEELEDELDAYADAEMLDRSAAVRKLLTDELTKWRREKAIARLRDGEADVRACRQDRPDERLGLLGSAR